MPTNHQPIDFAGYLSLSNSWIDFASQISDTGGDTARLWAEEKTILTLIGSGSPSGKSTKVRLVVSSPLISGVPVQPLHWIDKMARVELSFDASYCVITALHRRGIKCFPAECLDPVDAGVA